jgi:hypothetical protein
LQSHTGCLELVIVADDAVALEQGWGWLRALGAPTIPTKTPIAAGATARKNILLMNPVPIQPARQCTIRIIDYVFDLKQLNPRGYRCVT